jgi:hypothetical protein
MDRSQRHRSRWLAALAAWAVLCAAGASPAAEVVAVRVGDHPNFTRVVFELDSAAGYRIEQAGTDAAPELLVTVDASSSLRQLRAAGDVRSVKVDAGTKARALIALRKPGLRVQEMILSNPPRIVLDLIKPETALAAAPKPKPERKSEAKAAEPEAKSEPKPIAKAEPPKPAPIAKPEAKPELAAEPKPEAKPEPKPIAKAEPPKPAPIAKPEAKPELAAEPKPAPIPAEKPAVAKETPAPKAPPLAEAKPTPAPIPPAIQPVPRVTPPPEIAKAEPPKVPEAAKPMPSPAPVPAPIAPAPAPLPTPENVAKSPGAAPVPTPAPIPTPNAEPTPAPVPAPKPVPSAKPPAPAATPAAPERPTAGASWTDHLRDPIWLGGSAAVLIGACAAAFVIRRRRALPNDLDVTAIAEEIGETAGDGSASARIPSGGFAMSDEVTETIAMAPAGQDDSSFAGLLEDIDSPARREAPASAPAFSARPAPAARPTPAPAAKAAPAPDPTESLFEDAGGFVGDSDASEGDAPMNQDMDLPLDRRGAPPPSARMGGSAAAPAPTAASPDVARMLQEFERRIATLEARLDEANEAREKLERQVAAQSEELRVQRAAIARTQRALRTMTRGDEDKATEPALRDGDQTKTRITTP